MTVTANYDWTLPDVGASEDTWGAILNAAFVAIDADLQTIEDALLPPGTGATEFRNNEQNDARFGILGTAAGEVRTNAQNDARFPQRSNNLSDLASAGTARTNLGLGSMATLTAGTGGTQFRNNTENDARFAVTGTGATQVRTNDLNDARFHRSGTDTLAATDLPTSAAANTWFGGRSAAVLGSVDGSSFPNYPVGSVALVGLLTGSSIANWGASTTSAGSNLGSACMRNTGGSPEILLGSGGAYAGTWRNLGGPIIRDGETNGPGLTLAVRIT